MRLAVVGLSVSMLFAFAGAPGASAPAGAPAPAAGRVAAPAPAKTKSVKLNGHTFTLPEGFEIELAVPPTLVPRPIAADFDERGRLYVADSSGTNEKVEIQLEKKPHRIVRLDTDGDGKFDKTTAFADKMGFPEGVLCFRGSVYVTAPPSIWKLTDADGDGIAEKREEWFKGTLTHCANDLHGPYLGHDGRIYWCKGAFAQQTHEQLTGRPPLVTKAAHIFRRRADGGVIESVMTGGMDNPVDVVFTPGGERIFSTTFFQNPGGGKRDGLIHAVYGGVYGKDHAVVYDHPWTGPSLMPVLSHMGPAAVCGLTTFESDGFGPEYVGNLFAAQFNLRKVSRHVLTPEGATFRSRDEDFLVSDNTDFHPTDVIEDADGSLLVVDTGGWYKICCPTSQLHKPDILGGIYRIRRTDAPRHDDPRGLKIDWAGSLPAQLAGRLGDPRTAVVRRAIEELAARGAEAVPALTVVLASGSTPGARRNAVWALTRIENDVKARVAVRTALFDRDESVRQAAAHSAGLHRDAPAVPPLTGLLAGPSQHNRRAAAEALGRMGKAAAVPALLEAAAENNDRVLDHSITYALMEIGDTKALAAGPTHGDPRVRRAALVALDGVGKLTPDMVLGELDSVDAGLRDAAWWLVERHPEWGDRLAGVLGERLSRLGTDLAERGDLARRLAKLSKTEAIRGLVARSLEGGDTAPNACFAAMKAVAAAGLKETPPTWTAGLVRVLRSRNAELVGEAIVAVRALPVPKQPSEAVIAELMRIAADESAGEKLRVSAAAAAPGGAPSVPPAVFAFLVARLDPEQTVAVRSQSAEALSKARLTAEQLTALAGAFRRAGPMELDRLLESYTRSTDEGAGLAALQALAPVAVKAGLRGESVRTRFAKYGPAVKAEVTKLCVVLDADAEQQKAKLERMIAAMPAGDIRRGQAVFNSAKTACSACHAIGYVGGNTGPDLTRIGGIRNDRDLLESIIFPSAGIVRSYEPVVIATKDERRINGLIRSETADEIVLATGPNQETRIAKDDIEAIRPSGLSIMPAGLDGQLTPQELADLVAFLKACR